MVYMYLNGELIASEEAVISVFDHGYLYGVGLFETFRTYNKRPFLLTRHLDRLAEGCRQVGMKWPRNDEQIMHQVETLLNTNDLQDGYFRLNVSAGAHPVGLPHDPYTELTEALFVKEIPPRVTRKKLRTVQTRRNTPEGPFRLKSHHYLNNVIAGKEVPEGYEGVFLTQQGKVAEGIVSNLFFVREGVLYTPALSTGILNGITRQWVLNTARSLRVEVHEGEYDLAFAQEADEVFVTNSIQEIVSVTSWDDHDYPPLTRDSITNQLRRWYHPNQQSEVGKDG